MIVRVAVIQAHRRALRPSSVSFASEAAPDGPMPARKSLPSLGEMPLMRHTRRSAWCAAMVRSGIACSMALNTVSITVIGNVIHQRIAAGFTALTTVPGARITSSGRKLPSLIG